MKEAGIERMFETIQNIPLAKPVMKYGSRGCEAVERRETYTKSQQ
jgi:hypothetical protein